MSGFATIQSVLADWPNASIPEDDWGDNSSNRLRLVLARFQSNPLAVGSGDLAGLVRHVLRRETIANSDARPALRVPRDTGWPNQQLWRDSDVEVSPQGSSGFLIRAPRPWSANWLPGSDENPPLVAAFAEEVRRKPWPSSSVLPLDPALEDGLGLEFRGYSCPGQRQAIHAAFLLEPGSTLVVNLPTGSGKSLVAWAPALMAPQGSLTVMVTPTISLALDQERQLRDQYPPRIASQLPDSLAWHSRLPETTKRQIRRQLSDGTQRIIIASPEHIVTSLARPLYEAATTGRLKYFVVDEAHLVAQWGMEFRPEFQSMCGLRHELLQECRTPADRFRTLLLSATLSQESLDTLRDLFAEESFDTVSAVALRPEPEYWMSEALTHHERAQRITQLIRVVPRPFLLYVTKREHADDWVRRMGDLGIRRVGCVHGATPADVRSDVVEDWRAGELDVCSATITGLL